MLKSPVPLTKDLGMCMFMCMSMYMSMSRYRYMYMSMYMCTYVDGVTYGFYRVLN